MAEPASSTVGIALAAGTLTVTGSIFGVQYDALLAGFFGGLVSLSYLPAMTLARTAGSVAGSALLGGYAAPLASVAVANYFPFVAGDGAASTSISAFALGLCAQVAIPAALARLRKKGEPQ